VNRAARASTEIVSTARVRLLLTPDSISCFNTIYGVWPCWKSRLDKYYVRWLGYEAGSACSFYIFVSPSSQQISRMRFLRTHQTMELCSLALLLEVIKWSHRLQLVIKNSIQYILAPEISTIQLDALMATGSYHALFFLFLKVWFLAHFNLRNSFSLLFSQASQKERKSVAYQQFHRQLFHACLAYIYGPLKSAMTFPTVICCPDGHFRRSIFSIGPYIADYLEQVWLTTIVSGWCPT